MRYISNSEKETEMFGERFASFLKGNEVISFTGDLGAGKTAFIRGMARGLGIAERVTSPTFTIVNEYTGKRNLFHFDMYRLSGPEELYDIGWEDYLKRDGICAIEWSEVVSDAIPEDAIHVELKNGENDSQRIITVSGGEWSDC